MSSAAPAGSHPRTNTEKPRRNCGPSPIASATERRKLATIAASDLFDLLPPHDQTDAAKMMAGVVAVMANYHQDVIVQAALAVAQRTERVTIKCVTDVCNELQALVSRQIERVQLPALLPPSGPSEERRAEQIADWESRVKPLLASSLQRVAVVDPLVVRDDGHARRVMEDLERRRAARRSEDQSN